MLNPRVGMSSLFPQIVYELAEEVSPFPLAFAGENIFPLSTRGVSPDPRRAGA